MKKEKNALEYMNSIIEENNDADSFGAFMLKNGSIVFVRNYYETFSIIWKIYKTSFERNDDKVFNDINNETGGVIDTGDAIIDLSEIIASLPAHRFFQSKEVADEYEKKDKKILLYLNKTIKNFFKKK